MHASLSFPYFLVLSKSKKRKWVKRAEPTSSKTVHWGSCHLWSQETKMQFRQLLFFYNELFVVQSQPNRKKPSQTKKTTPWPFPSCPTGEGCSAMRNVVTAVMSCRVTRVGWERAGSGPGAVRGLWCAWAHLCHQHCWESFWALLSLTLEKPGGCLGCQGEAGWVLCVCLCFIFNCNSCTLASLF